MIVSGSFEGSYRVRADTAVQLARISFVDGRPRTLRIRPTSRTRIGAGEGFTAGSEFYVKLTITETLGPGQGQRVVFVPWMGASILIGGNAVEITAQLIAGTISGNATIQQACQVELGLRDGAPVPFETTADVHVASDFIANGGRVQVPAYATRIVPLFPIHNTSIVLQQYDSLLTTLNSGAILQNASGSYSAGTQGAIALLPACDSVLVYSTSSAPGIPGQLGFLFQGFN
jgi:hypothetical protein